MDAEDEDYNIFYLLDCRMMPFYSCGRLTKMTVHHNNLCLGLVPYCTKSQKMTQFISMNTFPRSASFVKQTNNSQFVSIGCRDIY